MSRTAFLLAALLASALTDQAYTAPIPPPRQPVIEVLFCVDTTRDMEGALAGLRRHFPAICAGCLTGRPHARLRVGLLAYRDRGDEYVTRSFGLTDDLRSVHLALQRLTAEGGGDAPESVNQALHEAVQQAAWTNDPGAIRQVVLVGSAPPHEDYEDDVPYTATCAAAAAKGIAIHTVLVGDDASCSACWQAIAARTRGRFLRDHESACTGGLAQALRLGPRTRPTR